MKHAKSPAVLAVVLALSFGALSFAAGIYIGHTKANEGTFQIHWDQ